MPASSEPLGVGEVADRLVILAKHLHARPAGRIAQAAARHQASAIELVVGQRRVNARSVLAVMGLGAVSGSAVRITVAGPDADAVADEVVRILESPDPDE